MKKKVILIRVNLSPKLGAGHFIRMIAFADLLKNSGYNINFISSSENKELINSVLNDKYPIIFTDKSDALEDAKFIIDVATKYTAKLVIFDGADFTEEYDIILRDAKLKTLHVVDVPKRVYSSDFVLNQNHRANDFDHLIGPNTTLLTGLKYLLLRDQFKVAKKTKLNSLRTEKIHLLICLSGGSLITDKMNETLLQALITSKDLVDSATIIFGKMGLITEKVKNMVLKAPIEVNLMNHLDDISQEMRKASFAITSGGTTMWELMFMQIPFIALALNTDQENYLKLLKRDNICEIMEDFDQMTVSQVKENLKKFMTNKLLHQQFFKKTELLMDSTKIKNQILTALNL